MRLFLAVDCNVQKESFNELQQSLPETNAVFAQTFHLTLKFLGETTSQELELIQEQLDKLIFASFELHFDHVGHFSHNKRKQIIWAGVQRKTRIKALQKEVDIHLEGIRKQQKKFLPHVTLVRITNAQTKMKHLVAVAKPIEPFHVVVDAIHLIQSTITPTGPIYKILQTVKAIG